MKRFGPLLGMNGPVDQGARRYLDAAGYGDDESGHFYATAHRHKAVGPVAVQTWPEYFVDHDAQESGFEAIIQLTRVGAPDGERRDVRGGTPAAGRLGR